MRYLGLDLGTKSLGISLSDKSNTIAMPYRTLHFEEDHYEEVLKDLEEIVRDKGITEFVLGLPKNMNNSLGFAAERSLHFKEKLEEYFHLPVRLVDERLSTVEAEKILITGDKSRKKRKKVIDNVASSLILETYLKQKEGNNEKR